MIQKIRANKYVEKLIDQLKSNMIMNWSNLHKCVLILSLSLFIHFLWVAWKIFIVLTPSIWQWVNLPLIKSQIFVNSASAFFIMLMISFCFLFQNRIWANKVLPHFLISIFIVMFILDGFLVGIYSPATIFAFVTIAGIGLLLFERKTIYFQLLVAFSIFLILVSCTYQNIIPYAPIFSSKLLTSTLYNNPFWVWSMVYFIIPILIGCLVLCEILLTQWRHREAQIKVMSQTDPLTNLYNRRFFNEQLDVLQQQKTHYAIILMDIDHFKEINDLYGHNYGDQALKQVAELLSSQVRQSDIVARYGGEEFIIAMPDATLETAHNIAERCRLAIQNQILESKNNHQVQLTASFGIATSLEIIDMNKIIQCADEALYRAKQLGRNRVQLYIVKTTDKQRSF